MWYALAELYDGNRTVELFYGQELQHVAERLAACCEELMQFDLEEMTMDEVDAYYTEGYDAYENMLDAPSRENISALHFGCNGGKIDTLAVVEGYDRLRSAFGLYQRGRLQGWSLVSAIEETEGELKALAAEWKAVNSGDFDEKKLRYFVR